MTPEDFKKYLQLAMQMNPGPIMAELDRTQSSPTPAATPPWNPESPWSVIMADKEKGGVEEPPSDEKKNPTDEPLGNEALKTLGAMFPKPQWNAAPFISAPMGGSGQVKLDSTIPESLLAQLYQRDARQPIPSLAELLGGPK